MDFGAFCLVDKYSRMLENGFSGKRRQWAAIMTLKTVLKVSGFSKNGHFTFLRFLSDRHEISKIGTKWFRIIYLTTRMPIFRPMDIFKNEIRWLNWSWFYVTEYRKSGNFEVPKVILPIFRKNFFVLLQSFGGCPFIL